MDDYDKNFEKKINIIKKMYNKKPLEVLNTLDNIINYFKKNVGAKTIKYRIIIIIFLLLLGLLNIKSSYFYYFFLVFFLSGLYLGLYVEKIGLLFFVSHGLFGLLLLESTILNMNCKDSFLISILSDSPSIGLYIYIGTIVLLLIVASIIVVLYNLSNKMKLKNYYEFIPVNIYTIAIFMSSILKYIINIF